MSCESTVLIKSTDQHFKMRLSQIQKYTKVDVFDKFVSRYDWIGPKNCFNNAYNSLTDELLTGRRTKIIPQQINLNSCFVKHGALILFTLRYCFGII